VKEKSDVIGQDVSDEVEELKSKDGRDDHTFSDQNQRLQKVSQQTANNR
jgi:hypothetical protein